MPEKQNCLGCGKLIEQPHEYCNRCKKERMLIKDKPRGYIN